MRYEENMIYIKMFVKSSWINHETFQCPKQTFKHSISVWKKELWKVKFICTSKKESSDLKCT